MEDISAQKAYEEQIRLLMREANHRAKNILSIVQAIARQTTAREPEDFIRRFTERLQALSANQDLLVRNEWHGVDVEDLARAQLAHFADLVGSRIATHGPKLRLNAAAAQAIGLAMHELATNAGKYGALSTGKGRVDVGWRSRQ
jgi:two-component sensor histidine kinase